MNAVDAGSLRSALAESELFATTLPALQPEIDDARERLRRLEGDVPRREGLCVMCVDGEAPATHMLQPCAHQCLCASCASRFQVSLGDFPNPQYLENIRDRCPVCSAIPRAVLRAYTAE